MNKVIIAGSRTIKDYLLVKSIILESKFKIDEVVCGEANGVDSLGKRWAQENNIPIQSFPADWKIYGRAAGYIRNGQMANYGNHLILIWTGDIKSSPGSRNMLKLAQEKGLTIFEKIVE